MSEEEKTKVKDLVLERLKKLKSKIKDKEKDVGIFLDAMIAPRKGKEKDIWSFLPDYENIYFIKKPIRYVLEEEKSLSLCRSITI